MAGEYLSRGDRTRRIVVEAAYRLILEKGYHAASMRQIAKHSGLALGGIYNHFSSKEEIFKTIILEYHPYRQVLPVLLAAPGESAKEFVHNAAHAMIAELGKRPDFVRLMFVEFIEFNGEHLPGIALSIIPQIRLIINRFETMDGGLRSISLFVLFRAFIGLFFSYYLTELLVAQAPVPEFQQGGIDDFVEIFLHGILTEEAK